MRKRTANMYRRACRPRGKAARILRERRCGKIFRKVVLCAAFCAALVCGMQVLDSEAAWTRGGGRNAREILQEALALAESWKAAASGKAEPAGDPGGANAEPPGERPAREGSSRDPAPSSREIARLSTIARLCVEQAEASGAEEQILQEMRQTGEKVQIVLQELRRSG